MFRSARKGSNVTAPAIRWLDILFQAGDLVDVVDEKQGKPIASGESLYDVEEAKNLKQRHDDENMRYVEDKTCNQLKPLTT